MLSGESTDIRYFITSVTDVRKAGKTVRAHWGIENRLHWTLDVTFDEDYSRIRRPCSIKYGDIEKNHNELN